MIMTVRILLVLTLVIFSACNQSAEEPASSAEDTAATLWYGGPIVTMNEDQPRVEAVVSSDDGEILFVSR